MIYLIQQTLLLDLGLCQIMSDPVKDHLHSIHLGNIANRRLFDTTAYGSDIVLKSREFGNKPVCEKARQAKAQRECKERQHRHPSQGALQWPIYCFAWYPQIH